VAPKIIAAAAEAFGNIDGLVINHGTIAPITTIAGSDAEEWRRAYDINVFGPVALVGVIASSSLAYMYVILTTYLQVKEAIPKLRKSNGRIVFISSGAAKSAYAGWGAYGTSKAAIDHICAHLAVEEPSIISVAVSPGKVDTDMQKVIREQGLTGMSPDIHASFIAEHEEGRLLRPDQPGTVIAKLAIHAPNSLNGKHYR